MTFIPDFAKFGQLRSVIMERQTDTHKHQLANIVPKKKAGALKIGLEDVS